MKYLLLTIGFVSSILVTPVRADISVPEPSEDFHYIFSFDYKVAKTAMREITDEISTGPRDPIIPGAYRIAVTNRTGQELAVVEFDAAAMADQAGIVRVSVPYQPSGVKAVLTGLNGEVIGQLDLSMRSTCNDDKTCDASVGENGYNCPSDCPKPRTPLQTLLDSPAPIVSDTPIATRGATSKRWGLILLALIAGSGAAGVGLLLHRYRSGLR